MTDVSLGDRFWSKVDKTGECWTWTAYINPFGYGRYWTGSTTSVAHRVSYEAVKGNVPEGFDLDHLCRVRHCVRPDHLEPVTRRENIRRGVSHVAGQMARGSCGRGHPYDSKNSYVDGRGKRVCRTCVRDKVREQRSRGIRYDRKKEAAK